MPSATLTPKTMEPSDPPAEVGSEDEVKVTTGNDGSVRITSGNSALTQPESVRLRLLYVPAGVAMVAELEATTTPVKLPPS